MKQACVYQIKSLAELREARDLQLFTAAHRSFDENLYASLEANRFMAGPRVKHGGFGRKACK